LAFAAFAATALAASAGTASVAAADNGATAGSVAKRIEDLDRRLNRLIVDGDVDGARALYDDDFVLTVSGRGFKTKSQMLADIGNPTLFLKVCETTEVVVRVRGKAAVLTGILRQAGEIDGRQFDVRLRVTDTWVLTEDGRWQLLAAHASPEKAGSEKAGSETSSPDGGRASARGGS
jgi:ketosteroid isomerase-like protein